MNVVSDVHSSSLSLAHPGTEAKTKNGGLFSPPFDSNLPMSLHNPAEWAAGRNLQLLTSNQ
jgi:hypothetical protein